MGMYQEIVIEWHPIETLPKKEGTYLIAFDDESVETYPISQADIDTGTIMAGYSKGLYWAYPLDPPE